MDNKSDEQLLIIQAEIEANKKESDEKMKKLTEYLKAIIKSTITSTMVQMEMYKPPKENRYSPKDEYPTTVVLANRRAPPLNSGHSTKIGGIWNLKHDIISPKFYEILIKT